MGLTTILFRASIKSIKQKTLMRTALLQAFGEENYRHPAESGKQIVVKHTTSERVVNHIGSQPLFWHTSGICY